MICQKFDQSVLKAKFSPFDNSLLAVGTSENFGIVGNSKLNILKMNIQTNKLIPLRSYQIPNAVYGLSFSEKTKDLLALVNGAGNFQMFNLSSNSTGPVVDIKLHKDVINSVSCNHFLPFLYLTAGVDGVTNLVDINTQKIDKLWMSQKDKYVNELSWHPKQKSIYSTVTANGTLQLFDLTQSKKQNILAFDNQPILSMDFNKYSDLIATGCADNSVKIYDIRNPKIPIIILSGHRYGVNCVRFSPFNKDLLVSSSFDMSVKSWNLKNLKSPLLANHNRHQEFVYDVEYSLFYENLIMSASIDKRICIFNALKEQPYL